MKTLLSLKALAGVLLIGFASSSLAGNVPAGVVLHSSQELIRKGLVGGETVVAQL